MITKIDLMEKLILGKKLNEKKHENCCISILCILNWDKKEQSTTQLCEYSLKENKEKYFLKKTIKCVYVNINKFQKILKDNKNKAKKNLFEKWRTKKVQRLVVNIF